MALGFCEIVSGSIQSGKAQPATETQSQAAIKQKGFRPVEQIDLLTGWQQIVAGTWAGMGLVEPLPDQQAIWGLRVLIVAEDINRQRLQAVYQGTMIFTPAEFLDVVERWPESTGLVQAKRAFGGGGEADINDL